MKDLKTGSSANTTDMVWSTVAEHCKSMLTSFVQKQKKAFELFIVCMDDEVLLLEYLTDLLSDTGLTVRSFAEPEQAVAFIKTSHSSIALIVSDFKMPGLNGFEARRQTLAVAADIPFFILSAFVDREMALAALELKIAGFLNKPLIEGELAALFSREVLPRIESLCETEELLTGFIEEARSLVEQVEEAAINLEEDFDNRDLFNVIFGTIHTLKGASSFFEPKTLHMFVHRYEDYLKTVQSSNEPEKRAGVGRTLLAAVDYLRIWVNEFESGQHGNYDTEAIFNEVISVAASGEVDREMDESSPAAGAASPTATTDKGPAKGKLELAKPKEVRVDVSVLDEFLVASGEMTVIRNMLNKAATSLVKRHSGDKDVQVLSELLSELHEINSSIQTKMTEVRKVSMRSVLKPIPRAVRDVGAVLGKNIELVTHGQDLRIDNSVADVLNGCLLHLVKNSIDHGLETPQERTANGKSPKGLLVIETKVTDSLITVRIEDDGKGINADAIRKKLVDLGTPQERVAKMSLDEIHNGIFASGLSTADKTTDISGRGVGMSMVKELVEAIGGRIIIRSQRGKGTTFLLELPVPKSVSIVNCLFIRAGGNAYGISQDQILRVFKSDENIFQQQVHNLEGAAVLQLEQDLYPILFLSDLIGSKKGILEEDFQAVILRTSQNQSFALIVDDVEDFEDTVVKSLPKALKSIGIFSGATFLSDGNVGLLLDVEGIAKKAALRSGLRLGGTTSNTVDPNQVVKTPPTSWIVFEIGVEGLYAFRESEVYRIEELRAESLQRAGPWAVIPYRGEVMPILEIDMPGKKSVVSPTANHDVFQVLVIRSQDRFQALRVHSIRDIVPSSAAIMAPLAPIVGVEGTLIANGQTLTILEPHVLIASVA